MSADPVPPELSPWGERLRERTAPLAPDDHLHGWAHAHLCAALAEAFVRVGEIYDPEDGLPGSPLVDVDACPDWALPYLAQMVGVTIPVGMDTATARAGIRGVAGWKRGTPAALRAAIAPLLTGNKTVMFRERDPDSPDPPYSLEIVTVSAETPDEQAVRAALLAQKPAGIVLDYHTVEGIDYQELTATGPDPYSALDDTYSTYRLLREGPP